MLFAAVLLFAVTAPAQEIANFSRGQQVVSPEVYDGGSVTFRLAADAHALEQYFRRTLPWLWNTAPQYGQLTEVIDLCFTSSLWVFQ